VRFLHRPFVIVVVGLAGNARAMGTSEFARLLAWNPDATSGQGRVDLRYRVVCALQPIRRMIRIALFTLVIGGCLFDQPRTDCDEHRPVVFIDPSTAAYVAYPNDCVSPGSAPNLAHATTACSGGNEEQCLTVPGCHPAYQDAHDGSPPQFIGCWETPMPTASSGSCADLDAQACSQHDNCSPLYSLDAQNRDSFARCFDKPQTHDPGDCAQATCTATPPTCVDSTPGVVAGCYTGYCIPPDKCGVRNAGTCAHALCATPAPACPVATTPGVSNGCYTGFCIPIASCP
jgi:hypothetical protein